MVRPCNASATTIDEVQMTEANPVPSQDDNDGCHEEAKQSIEEDVVADDERDPSKPAPVGEMEVSPQVSPPGSPPLRRVVGEEVPPVMSPSGKPRDSGSWTRSQVDASSDGSDSEGVVIVDGSEDIEEPSMREVHLRG